MTTRGREYARATTDCRTDRRGGVVLIKFVADKQASQGKDGRNEARGKRGGESNMSDKTAERAVSSLYLISGERTDLGDPCFKRSRERESRIFRHASFEQIRREKRRSEDAG